MQTQGAALQLVDDLDFALRLADAADEITRAGFVAGRGVDHEIKPDGSPVSRFDEAVERALLATVQAERPDDALLGEEVGAHGDARRRWVIDGIDGTTNFVRGLPLWGTLIGLVEDGVPVLGVGSSPSQDRRWWAARGQGAWTSSSGDAEPQRLTVADAPRDRQIRANLELAWDGHPLRALLDDLADRVEPVTMTAHPAFMVADGQIDLVVQADGGPWDFAAVMPIVWEAGGSCLSLDGTDMETPEPPMVYVGNLDAAQVWTLLQR